MPSWTLTIRAPALRSSSRAVHAAVPAKLLLHNASAARAPVSCLRPKINSSIGRRTTRTSQSTNYALSRERSQSVPLQMYVKVDSIIRPTTR